MWRLRDGVAPVPGIGTGPLTDEQFDAAEQAYMVAHFGQDAIPDEVAWPRESGGYLRIPDEVDVTESDVEEMPEPAPAAPKKSKRPPPGPGSAAKTEESSA